MKEIIVLLFTFGMALCVNPSAHAQDTLTVMSYNIYHGEQAYEAGEGSVQDIASLINEIEPDYVALQEVDEMTGRIAALNVDEPFSLIDSLATLTNMTGYFGKAIDYDGGGYGNGLLSKEPLQPQKLMMPNPKGGEKRSVLYIKATLPSGQPVIFASTHLGVKHKENRQAQLRVINHSFGDQKVSIMIAGDFNSVPDSDLYRNMESRWIDAAMQVAGQPEPTFSAQDPRRRIDYLFLSKGSNWEVLDLYTIDVAYSDHLPLVAKVVIRKP